MPPRDNDENGTPAKLAKPVGVEQVGCCRGARHGDHDHIGGLKQAGELLQLSKLVDIARFFHLQQIDGDHLHFKGLRPHCNCPANFAQANHAECAPLQGNRVSPDFGRPFCPGNPAFLLLRCLELWKPAGQAESAIQKSVPQWWGRVPLWCW
jgi:hypothetical protein